MVGGRVRPALGAGAVDNRPLSVRAGAPVGLGGAEAETCRAGLGAGIGGGAIAVRPVGTDARGLTPSGGLTLEGVPVLVMEGVPVLDGTPLDGAVPSCLVGDLVGD